MLERFDIPGTQNLQMLVEGSVLYLYCDLSKNLGASSSGKSVLISSSSGNKPLGKSGAFLGFNVFTKSLEKRDLSEAGIGELRKTDFTAVADGCQWRVEDGAATLCVKIDFDKVKARAASSGKSVLLVTTGGNKPIASSGLFCGLNCYHPTGEKFVVAQLAEGAGPEEELRVGQSTDLDGGFKVTYVADDKMTIQYTYETAKMADGHVASNPAFHLGDLTVVLHVAAVKAARARTEKGSAESPPTPSQSQSSTGSHGDFLVVNDKESKVRNVVVSCTADGSADAYDLVFTFDPTRHYGRSSSGKSLTVASTGGFQRVVDRDGRVVCRASLNGHRPAPPIQKDEIAAAVQKVLSAKRKADLADLSFKVVLAEVMAELGAGEALKEKLRATVKAEVAAFLKSVV